MTHDEYSEALDKDRAYVYKKLTFYKKEVEKTKQALEYWENQYEGANTLCARANLKGLSAFSIEDAG